MKLKKFLQEIIKDCCIMSMEKPCTIPSGSEIERWMQNGSIIINGERVTKDEILDFPLTSIVIFPKSKDRKITLL
jgi:hypothetical protein